MIQYIISAVILLILLVFLYIAWRIAKKLFFNSILGLIILGILYAIGVEFENWLAVFVVTVLFGIPGILVVLVLKYFFAVGI